MKKILLSLTLMGTAFPAFAQQYKISGKAPEGATKVYFSNAEDRQQVDSVAVVDGKFTFEGDAQGKMFGWIYTAESDRLPVYLEDKVNASLTDYTVIGSTENTAFNKWFKRIKVFQDRTQEVYQEAKKYGKSMPDEVRDQLLERLDKIGKEHSEELRTLFASNEERLFPAYFLSQAEGALEKSEIIALVEAGHPYTQLSILDRVKSKLEAWKRQAVGATFTDLTLPDTTGTARKLSDYVGKGKYVLIDFWASWCGPCIREMPNVKRAYERFHEKGFDIVGISFDRDRKNWVGAIQRLDLPWHHLSDLKFWEAEAGKVYGINGIPFMLLVDPNGTIIANDLRGEALQEKLEEIFGE